MKKNNGFTMLEIVVAILIITAMMTLLGSTFGPYLRQKQDVETKLRIQDLKETVEKYYSTYAYFLDSNNEVENGYGKLALPNFATNPPSLSGDFIETLDCTSPGVNDLQVTNLKPLQGLSTKSIQEISKDGYNNSLCFFISDRSSISYEGATLYYRTIAIVSKGENGLLDPATLFRKDPTVDRWILTLGGDDKGVIVDTSPGAIESYINTKSKLNKYAKAYEAYFKARYLARIDRELDYNYFVSSTPTNSALKPEPLVTGTYAPSQPRGFAINSSLLISSLSDYDDVLDNGIWYILGMTDSDLTDAWGNAILIDNASDFVRTGKVTSISDGQAPFTAMFIAKMPGAETDSTCSVSFSPFTCKRLLISTAVSTY